ncbi:MAG TPA: hypothetical protein VFE42_08030 [Chloroflexota bacterium]|nr:hypothetical protein [Chloroflexota bacterium]
MPATPARPLVWSLMGTLCVLAVALFRPALSSAQAAGAALSTTMTGNIVAYAMSGFEPDFDPIYRVVISGDLDVSQPEYSVVPDQELVISAYLENFQPTTTPILPDLLHPNQTASSLGGFMTGKAALANAAGVITYKGVVLIETFLDNSAHFVMTLDGQGPAGQAPPLRLRGSFTLYKNLTIQGAAQATRSLTTAELAAWSAPHGHPLSWQSIVGQLTVAKPRMMGTSGGTSPSSALQRHPSPPPPAPLVSGSTISIVVGVVAFMVSLLLWQWPALVRLRRSPRDGGAPGTAGDQLIGGVQNDRR